MGPARYRKFPHCYEHAGIYLVLAKLLLGALPDAQVPGCAARAQPRRPNLRTIIGLIEETLVAYAGAVADSGPEAADTSKRSTSRAKESSSIAAIGELAWTALWTRHGSVQRDDDCEALHAELIGLWKCMRRDPTLADITKVPVLAFAMVYLNGLQWMGRIRPDAVTAVVNRLADVQDLGELSLAVSEVRADVVAAMQRFTARMDGFRTGGVRYRAQGWRP